MVLLAMIWVLRVVSVMMGGVGSRKVGKDGGVVSGGNVLGRQSDSI